MPSGDSTAGAWVAGSAVGVRRATPGGPVNFQKRELSPFLCRIPSFIEAFAVS
jgi:hypothetical protein